MAEMSPFEIIVRCEPQYAKADNSVCLQGKVVAKLNRCRDCEYWDTDNEARLDKGCFFCSCYGGYTRPEFFCATGMETKK